MATRLDRDRIVTEAIALMAEGGLGAVSLRAIAGRLAVQAPSLYHHFASKDALFGAMADRIFGACVARVPPCPTWEAWLIAFARSIWRAQHETPGALQLILAGRERTSGNSETIRAIVATLETLGLAPSLAHAAQASVQSLVTGWTMIGRQAAEDDPVFTASLHALIQGWQAEQARLRLLADAPRSPTSQR